MSIIQKLGESFIDETIKLGEDCNDRNFILKLSSVCDTHKW
jgi:hypothetical protein